MNPDPLFLTVQTITSGRDGDGDETRRGHSLLTKQQRTSSRRKTKGLLFNNSSPFGMSGAPADSGILVVTPPQPSRRAEPDDKDDEYYEKKMNKKKGATTAVGDFRLKEDPDGHDIAGGSPLDHNRRYDHSLLNEDETEKEPEEEEFERVWASSSSTRRSSTSTTSRIHKRSKSKSQGHQSTSSSRPRPGSSIPPSSSESPVLASATNTTFDEADTKPRKTTSRPPNRNTKSPGKRTKKTKKTRMHNKGNEAGNDNNNREHDVQGNASSSMSQLDLLETAGGGANTNNKADDNEEDGAADAMQYYTSSSSMLLSISKASLQSPSPMPPPKSKRTISPLLSPAEQKKRKKKNHSARGGRSSGTRSPTVGSITNNNSSSSSHHSRNSFAIGGGSSNTMMVNSFSSSSSTLGLRQMFSPNTSSNILHLESKRSTSSMMEDDDDNEVGRLDVGYHEVLDDEEEQLVASALSNAPMGNTNTSQHQRVGTSASSNAALESSPTNNNDNKNSSSPKIKTKKKRKERRGSSGRQIVDEPESNEKINNKVFPSPPTPKTPLHKDSLLILRETNDSSRRSRDGGKSPSMMMTEDITPSPRTPAAATPRGNAKGEGDHQPRTPPSVSSGGNRRPRLTTTSAPSMEASCASHIVQDGNVNEKKNKARETRRKSPFGRTTPPADRKGRPQLKRRISVESASSSVKAGYYRGSFMGSQEMNETDWLVLSNAAKNNTATSSDVPMPSTAEATPPFTVVNQEEVVLTTSQSPRPGKSPVMKPREGQRIKSPQKSQMSAGLIATTVAVAAAPHLERGSSLDSNASSLIRGIDRGQQMGSMEENELTPQSRARLPAVAMAASMPLLSEIRSMDTAAGETSTIETTDSSGDRERTRRMLGDDDGDDDMDLVRHGKSRYQGRGRRSSTGSVSKSRFQSLDELSIGLDDLLPTLHTTNRKSDRIQNILRNEQQQHQRLLSSPDLPQQSMHSSTNTMNYRSFASSDSTSLLMDHDPSSGSSDKNHTVALPVVQEDTSISQHQETLQEGEEDDTELQSEYYVTTPPIMRGITRDQEQPSARSIDPPKRKMNTEDMKNFARFAQQAQSPTPDDLLEGEKQQQLVDFVTTIPASEESRRQGDMQLARQQQPYIPASQTTSNQDTEKDSFVSNSLESRSIWSHDDHGTTQPVGGATSDRTFPTSRPAAQRVVEGAQSQSNMRMIDQAVVATPTVTPTPNRGNGGAVANQITLTFSDIENASLTSSMMSLPSPPSVPLPYLQQPQASTSRLYASESNLLGSNTEETPHHTTMNASMPTLIPVVMTPGYTTHSGAPSGVKGGNWMEGENDPILRSYLVSMGADPDTIAAQVTSNFHNFRKSIESSNDVYGGELSLHPSGHQHQHQQLQYPTSSAPNSTRYNSEDSSSSATSSIAPSVIYSASSSTTTSTIGHYPPSMPSRLSGQQISQSQPTMGKPGQHVAMIKNMKEEHATVPHHGDENAKLMMDDEQQLQASPSRDEELHHVITDELDARSRGERRPEEVDDDSIMYADITHQQSSIRTLKLFLREKMFRRLVLLVLLVMTGVVVTAVVLRMRNSDDSISQAVDVTGTPTSMRTATTTIASPSPTVAPVFTSSTSTTVVVSPESQEQSISSIDGERGEKVKDADAANINIPGTLRQRK